MRLFAIVLSVVAAGRPAVSDAAPAEAGASVTVSRCLVSLSEEAQVPAQEAGLLVSVAAREGQQVSVDDVLGQIDATQAEADKRVAELQLSVAKEKAVNDINLRFAKAAADVAKAEYDVNVTMNREFPKAVAAVELNRLRLVWQKAILSIEQSQQDRKIFGLEEKIRQAELDAAQAQVARRKICSPLDGVVVKCYRHAGEWVKPGDPAFHVVRMDRLRIEGFLSESRYAPSQIDGRPVSIEVALSGGRRARFTGKIIFVSPLVQAGGEYRLWAEVFNRQEDQHWLLRPGQLAEITIQLDNSRNPQSAQRINGRPAPRE